jgi:YD repeat-containing protein
MRPSLRNAGAGGRQGLLRSWATKRRLATVDTGAAGLTAYVYDAAGRLVETVSGVGNLTVAGRAAWVYVSPGRLGPHPRQVLHRLSAAHRGL